MSSRTADGAGALSALLAAAAGPNQIPADPEDQDTDDVPAGVDEDALDHDEIDTDQVSSPD